MANEIFAKIEFFFDYTQSSQIIVAKIDFRADALARYNRSVQNVGTSWEALEIGDLVKQYILIRNLSENYVSFGKSVADATEIIRILPGEFSFFYLIAAAPAVKADTAACDIEIKGVEGSD